MNQRRLNIITPVKDSLETAFTTIESVIANVNINFNYTVYDDFSSPENKHQLAQFCRERGVQLIHLEDLCTHPSPNYRTILQHAQQQALFSNSYLIIVESDVQLLPDTIVLLSDFARKLHLPGMIAAVTTDIKGEINFPYLYAKRFVPEVNETSKRLSFCCTLLANEFLQSFDFHALPASKDWFDVYISRKSIQAGFINYVVTSLKVLHLPHSSRPWKHEKYAKPVKYYLKKWFGNRDRI